MHYQAEVFIPSNKNVEAQIERIMSPYDENERCVFKEIKEGDEDYEDYDEDKITGKRGYWTNPKGFWDWFEIGGRWSGEHDDYDPYSNPINYEPCYICGGTGFRCDNVGMEARDDDPTYTCNGCGQYDNENKVWTHGKIGKGLKPKWNVARYDGDVVAIKDIKKELTAYTLIVNGEVFHKKEWNGETFVDGGFNGNVLEKLKELGITDGYLVTVDYHN